MFQSLQRRFGSEAYGHATAHWQYFGLRQQPETGLASSTFLSQDTLLGGAIERVKLDDGSYLNVLDNSDLADFIHHHAWFESDEVALPREDRVYMLGNLTGQTPKKRRVSQSRSDLKVLNAACSFPTETEQHELDPQTTRLLTMKTVVTVKQLFRNRRRRVRRKSFRISITIVGTRARRSSSRLFVSVVPDQRFLTMCDESSSVQHLQPKGILQNPDFQQRCRGPFASTKHLVWTFLRSSLQTVPKLFSATWCVGARCTNCVFLLWTRLLRLWQSVLQSVGSSIFVLRW